MNSAMSALLDVVFGALLAAPSLFVANSAGRACVAFALPLICYGILLQLGGHAGYSWNLAVVMRMLMGVAMIVVLPRLLQK